jgi:hypothetical protein
MGKEGVAGRTLTLFHQTSCECAGQIAASELMKCGSRGMLGAGIYFATSIEAAAAKAHKAGIVIEAEVTVGVQLIVEGSWPNMDLAFLRGQGADSVKGIGHATGDEIVVYEAERVKITKYHPRPGEVRPHSDEGSVPLSAKPTSPVPPLACGNPRCANCGRHCGGPCHLICPDPTCVDYGHYHEGTCRRKCQDRRCQYYGQYHPGFCTLPCQNFSCRMHGQYHFGMCILPCQNAGCRNYGQFHIGICEFPCMSCGKYHFGLCQSTSGMFHSGPSGRFL